MLRTSVNFKNKAGSTEKGNRVQTIHTEYIRTNICTIYRGERERDGAERAREKGREREREPKRGGEHRTRHITELSQRSFGPYSRQQNTRRVRRLRTENKVMKQQQWAKKAKTKATTAPFGPHCCCAPLVPPVFAANRSRQK